VRQKFRTRSHFTLGQLKVDENQVSAARMADDAITPRRRQYVGHWREWPTDTPPVHRRQHMLGHAVRPVSDKYAFQATDKRTTNEQTNKMRSPSRKATVFAARLNPLDSKGNYSAASNNTKLVHWPLMGGLLHLVLPGGAWAGCGPDQSPSRCAKCNSLPINGQCTNHCIAI